MPEQVKGTNFPPAFLAALEKDLQSRLDRMEEAFSGRVDDLISRTREEAALKARRIDGDVQRAAERLMTARARKLRSVAVEGREKLHRARLDRLECSVREQLEQFRRNDGYADYLAAMLDQCRRSGCGKVARIIAEEREASLLHDAAPLTEIGEEQLESWGGFILIDEGGALYDCTFRTRWQRYRSRLPAAESDL